MDGQLFGRRATENQRDSLFCKKEGMEYEGL